MRKNRPPSDRPPHPTGDLDADADAALAWLYEHADEWLDDEADGPPDGGVAA